MCKVYTRYHGTSEIEYGLCACSVDSPLAKARGLSPQFLVYICLFLTDLLNPKLIINAMTLILKYIQ